MTVLYEKPKQPNARHEDTCNTLIIKDLKPENAVNFISRQLPNRRLVMLNEAHHLPMCRLFAIQLLDSLKKNGFNCVLTNFIFYYFHNLL